MAKKKALRIKKIDHKKFREYYITANIISNKTFTDLDRLLNNFLERKINIISVTFFNGFKQKKILRIFKDYPIIMIGNSIRESASINSSILIHALQGDSGEVTYLREGKETIGARFHILDGIEGLYLKTPENVLSTNFEKDALRAYATLKKTIDACGFSIKDIYRFWIYMANIKKNYFTLNKVRDKFFLRNKIELFPSSTGIESKFQKSKKISLSVEAIRSTNKGAITVKNLRSGFQCESRVYGPKFSRAILLQLKSNAVKKVFISGTSSVSLTGGSVFDKKYERNVEYVIFCIEHLLKKADMSLDDIVAARVYFKNSMVRKAFNEMYVREKWSFPFNSLLTNICRDSFVFEMECIGSSVSKEENYLSKNHMD